MTALNALIRRNIKLFFMDKGLFFASLITPLILLALYSTFLDNVYRENFISALPGARRDLTVAPVRSSVLALAYFAAAFAVMFLICMAVLAAGLGYTPSAAGISRTPTCWRLPAMCFC